MSTATVKEGGGLPKPPAAAASLQSPPVASMQRIPGAFQLGLALYIILTGDFPTVVQAIAFGLPGGGDAAFATAMITALARDMLLLVPVLLLANHPLGILHPLLLAVVVWPIVIGMPKVIEVWGGWAGVFAGLPVDTPRYHGLPSHDAAKVWTATAKYNGVLILSLLSTYFGFWVLTSKRAIARSPTAPLNTVALRNVLIGLFGASMLTLLVFLYLRGGLVEHLTSLGLGRFRELKDAGLFIVISDLGSIAVYLWIAARPGDARSPLFLAALGAATASQFVSGGSRGQALLVPLLVGLIWAVRRQKVPWKLGLLLVPFMFASIGLLGAVRTATWSGQTAGEAFSGTGWAESFKLAQEEIAERRAASANVPIVERAFQVTGPLLGSSYIAAVTAFVPRTLWPDKPRAAGSLYAQTFLRESKEGAAIPVTPPVEMYWNFGLPGVLLLSMLYGALIKGAYNFMWRRYPNPFAVVFYMLFITTFQFATRPLVGFEQQVGQLLFCYVVVSMLVPKVSVAPVPKMVRRSVTFGPLERTT